MQKRLVLSTNPYLKKKKKLSMWYTQARSQNMNTVVAGASSAATYTNIIHTQWCYSYIYNVCISCQDHYITLITVLSTALHRTYCLYTTHFLKTICYQPRRFNRANMWMRYGVTRFLALAQCRMKMDPGESE